MSQYNVSGKADAVSELIQWLKNGSRERVVTDVWPSPASGQRDLNVRVEDDQEDGFVDFCEEHGIKFELV